VALRQRLAILVVLPPVVDQAVAPRWRPAIHVVELRDVPMVVDQAVAPRWLLATHVQLLPAVTADADRSEAAVYCRRFSLARRNPAAIAVLAMLVPLRAAPARRQSQHLRLLQLRLQVPQLQ